MLQNRGEQRDDSRDSEPGDAYLDMIKFGGFPGIVVGSFIAACGILVTWSSLLNRKGLPQGSPS
ncbi:hypothetical protein [Paenibacillus chibensis]|uniref:hypothetical protein n=1 Tax=Paenibacillus chibensis TaxID=59846 RepID=UPI0013E3CDF6|nr:hypothetical protein [Paenibacillus chibensis]MEC0370670.1 hypothetical protein [Paenibacillus chibensis]